ncbi:hypothetical protein GMO_08610 [Gluconobacter morbifer G707]|uniref:Uncharacterized protein n=1 Tax=Gluconobacter morbifer G707 TaxID=1088869 RepID=G6XH95_9PROT|nr:hypothetical protein GMO_08610 [Gluconobacter morbifer G707]
MFLLAAGSTHGSSILFQKSPFRSHRLGLQRAGFALLITSLFLEFHRSDFPIIDTLTWIGLLTLEVLFTALIFTALNARRRSVR